MALTTTPPTVMTRMTRVASKAESNERSTIMARPGNRNHTGNWIIWPGPDGGHGTLPSKGDTNPNRKNDGEGKDRKQNGGQEPRPGNAPAALISLAPRACATSGATAPTMP